MGWLSGWTYRKSHVINSASGAGTNYQVRVKAHYGSGTDNGEDVYLNSHCRTDFGDVRFTDDDGVTLLDYWMQKKVDSDYAIFWVEVADDLSTANATIYVYYGKSDATTTSNGNNTFLLFDDFDDGSFDTNKWTALAGTPSESNGLLTLPSSLTRVCSVSSFSMNVKVVALASMTPYSGGSCELGFAAVSGTNRTVPYIFTFSYAHTSYPYFTYRDDEDHPTSLARDTVFRVFTAKRISVSNRIWNIDDGYQIQCTNTKETADVKVWFQQYQATNLRVDWVFVAKAVDPEPAHGAWGSEEQAGGGQVYEIFVDAVSQSLSTPAYETTYNIGKEASVAIQGLTTSETTFNISKDAVVNALADMLVEVVTGVIEIFKDAIATAHILCKTETTFNISREALAQALTQTLFELGIAKDAVVKASASSVYEVTFTLPLDAIVKVDALSILESTFHISQEATIKVLAEVSVIKPTEVKVTKLFLIIGDLAIQIQGN